MAFDPLQEDCLRLILSAMQREQVFPLENAEFIAQATKAFQQDPSSLIRTDRDRSFHLVCKATEIIDYRVPFLPSEEEVERQLGVAENYLREAVELDEDNWDAKRMLAIVQSESDDELVTYLTNNREAVAADAARLLEEANDPYALEYARDLGQRPHLRWLASLASRYFIAGQYRRALATAEESLALSPLDPAGVRHTGVLALAKLEVSAEEFARFRTNHALAYQVAAALASQADPQFTASQPANMPTGTLPLDPWTLIAEISLAYRSFDFERATAGLRTLMNTYPRAAQPLYFQAEFPDGAFSRVHVMPGSEDELVLALSEATPLLQEGMGTPDAASFAIWIAEHELVQAALSAQDLQFGEQMSRRGNGGDN